MSSSIIQFTREEFLSCTSCQKNATSINYMDRSFKKGPTFSHDLQKQALRYCQKLISKSLDSLLVEDKYSFTIWIQEDSLKAKLSDSKQETVSSPEAETTNSSQAQKVLTKKVTRTYRGQTYEVEIPDYTAMQQALQNKQKPRRKYRGQYID